MKRKPSKPKRMKTYRTWQVVNEDGTVPMAAEEPETPKQQVQEWLEPGQRIARVEIREIVK